MKRPLLLLASTLTLESLLGCGYTEFPQYSGKYELQEVSYTDPSFAGEYNLPSTLHLVNRMEHIGGYWDHRLKFEFISHSQDQAAGVFTLELDDLARIDDRAWPNDWYDGAELHQEPKVYGTGTFCNYQYLYFFYLGSVPPVEVLQNVYPGKGEYIGDDPSTKMPLYISLAHPEEVDFDDTEWYGAIEENDGITLYFTFARQLRSEFPGWEDGYKDCILLSDTRGSESLTFTYHANLENLDDETDIRKGKVEEIKEDRPSISFFRKVVSNVK